MFRLKYPLLLLLLCAVAVPAFAGKRQGLPQFEMGLSVSTAAVYNSNILRLSESDRVKYLNSPNTFHDPIKSVDDAENETSIKPELKWRAPLSLMATAQYTLKVVTRARNSFTNYQSHTLNVSVRPRVRGSNWAIQARVFTIPSFYLRTYRDRDFGNYGAARFSNWDYSGDFKYSPMKKLWIEVGTGYGTYYYDPRFTEYDSEVRDYSAGASYEFPRHIVVDASYVRSLNDNVGKNQPSTNTTRAYDIGLLEDTDYGDADYHEDEFNAKVSVWLPWIWFARTDASLAYKLRRRVYTTDAELIADPFHRGRLDRRTQLTPALSVIVSSQIKVNGYFTYEERKTSSDHPSVPLAKNYIRREMGIGIDYTVR